MADISVFFSYARADAPLLAQLKKQLMALKHQGLIHQWYDREIAAGLEWMRERVGQLNSASIIALLVSPDFIASEYTYGTEMRRAMDRHEAGLARVIPILLRPVIWEGAPFAKIQALPSDGLPITSWKDQDEACKNVAEGFRAAIKDMQKRLASSSSHLAAPASAPPAQLFTVPFRRDSFFTGREEILTELHTLLASKQPAALTQPETPALSGLGGIGKTQTAIEYAYRHRADYSHILWIRAATEQEIIGDFTSLATRLNLSEKDATEQARIIAAVKGWLAATPNWLLIFDNADDLPMVARYFLDDSTASNGRILLTTRAQIMSGLAHKIDLESMLNADGALLLLRRARLLAATDPIEKATPADLAAARQLVQELGGLPLALNQAGAYIEETQCGLPTYLKLYQTHRADLLNRRGGQPDLFGHPDSVATTLRLSFQEVQQANAAAADLLCLCALLAPDAIPEEIFSEGASELGPILGPTAADPLALNNAIGELLKYSLIRRDPTKKILTLHRLVQAVLIDEMDQQTQQLWAEYCIKAVSDAFPDPKPKVWPECERLLLQGQACIDEIKKRNISIEEAGSLLIKVGFYLNNRYGYLQGIEDGYLQETEALYRLACRIYEREMGPLHLRTMEALNNLAELYRNQGKYKEAEESYKRVRVVWERELGNEHPSTIAVLNNLAGLYQDQERYTEAETLYEQVRATSERKLGTEHLSTMMTLHNLAKLRQFQGKYSEAEVLYERVRSVWEQELGTEDLNTIAVLNNLARLYQDQARYTAAEGIYRQVLEVLEMTLGSDHLSVMTILNDFAGLYRNQERYKEAEELYLRVKRVREQKLGAEHPSAMTTLHNLARLYQDQERYKEAEELYLRVKRVREQKLGTKHPSTLLTLKDLSRLYRTQRRYIEAEKISLLILDIDEKIYGNLHPKLLTDLTILAGIYDKQNKDTQAQKIEKRIVDIKSRAR